MANCSKCGYKLKLTDWRPNCPKCGVNLVYYGMEDRLLADADKAESEHAVFQKKIDRIKAAFVGSPLAIVRIILCILPIAALFLPLAKISISAPYIAESTTINVMKIYETVSSMDFGALLKMFSSPVLGASFKLYAAAIVCVLLAAVSALVSIFLLLLSCSPKGKQRNLTLAGIGLVSSVAAGLLFNSFANGISPVFPGAFTGAVSWGAYVFSATFMLIIAVNIVLAVKPIEVKYKQVYVGGLRSEEYFELVASGADLGTIRARMSEAQAQRDAEEAEKKAAEAAAKAEAEAEKGTVSAAK